jgi:hypothetical protein
MCDMAMVVMAAAAGAIAGFWHDACSRSSHGYGSCAETLAIQGEGDP